MSNDDQDRSTWDKAKMHFLKLTQADADEQLDETVRKPLADKGSTDNWRLGLLINLAQAILGIALYVYTSGVLTWLGAILAGLAVFAIVKWVVGL